MGEENGEGGAGVGVEEGVLIGGWVESEPERAQQTPLATISSEIHLQVDHVSHSHYTVHLH